MKTSKTLFATFATLVLTAACSEAGPLAPEPSSFPAAHRTQANSEVTTTTVTTTEEVIDEEERRCWIDMKTGAKRCRL